MDNSKLEKIANEVAKSDFHLEYEKTRGRVTFFASFDCAEENKFFADVKEKVNELGERVKSDAETIKEKVPEANTDFFKPVYTRNFYNNQPRWFCSGFSVVFGDVNNLGSIDEVVKVLEELGYKEM